jgi:Undecaprenyl-phosphate glucose phosphotransferase
MLRRHGEVLRTGVAIADVLLVAASWLGAYWIRFYTVLEAPQGVAPIGPYLTVLLVMAPAWLLLFRSAGLYEAQRTGSLLSEAGRILRANAIGLLLLVTLTFFWKRYFFSRGVIAIFFVLASGSAIAFRFALRGALRALRRRGYNLRHVLVAGSGQLAEEVIDRLRSRPEVGLRIVGVLSAEVPRRDRELRGVPVLGDYASVKHVLRGVAVDEVVVALPSGEWAELEKLMAELDDELVSIRLVPDLLQLKTLCSSVEELDGLPLINLRQGPLVGWAAVQKRVFDVLVSGAALFCLAPLLGAIALAVRLTSGRGVLYAQERVGLDGRVFRMLKFRTMAPDAEQATGPVWASPDDQRRTRLGSLLRRTSLDELPQLWNVLRGDMSLVGPRPERPVFIEQFRCEIPGYMLRHKIKAGVTGWAQIHGWRGDTSLHERIEHDLYYIQNWSLALDVRILVATAWRGFRNAY